VRCSNCHEPHAATLRAPGNAVCTQCHSPAGNPAFPSLPLAVFDGPGHHFHAPDSAGAECVACHMLERTYMGIDGRRDHSFRVPRPDLAATGSPDACTDCHADREPAWAAAEFRARFPASRHRGPHVATAFASARQDPALAVPRLLDLAEDPDGPGIVRATALELLAGAGDAALADRVGRLLSDPDPLVRAAAAGALRGVPPDERLVRLAPLLSDPPRAVREATAKALLDARPEPGTPEAAALAAALREWWEALMLRADFPETHLQLGGAALTLRDFALALEAFGQAAALDPQMVEAWSMVVRLEAAMGDPAAARATLARALAANPGNETLLALEAAP
jgi:predicted CXXCH cytochrome family protein